MKKRTPSPSQLSEWTLRGFRKNSHVSGHGFVADKNILAFKGFNPNGSTTYYHSLSAGERNPHGPKRIRRGLVLRPSNKKKEARRSRNSCDSGIHSCKSIFQARTWYGGQVWLGYIPKGSWFHWSTYMRKFRADAFVVVKKVV